MSHWAGSNAGQSRATAARHGGGTYGELQVFDRLEGAGEVACVQSRYHTVIHQRIVLLLRHGALPACGALLRVELRPAITRLRERDARIKYTNIKLD